MSRTGDQDRSERDGVVIIGAGIGGLVAAALLAGRGVPVTVVERMAAPGGKLRTVDCGGVAVDAGPTVFTARWVFEAIFAELGADLDDHLTLVPSERLARHAWQDGSQLDLWADPARSRDAIAAFAGPDEARGWDAFRAESARIWNALEHRYMEAPVTSPVGLALRFGIGGMGEMLAINPFQTLWTALGKHFRDPRLHQLYGRYATYCGASPYEATATLMLIAHLEARGVWLVEGGMHKVAEALAGLAAARGAQFRYGAHVESIRVVAGRAAGVVLASGEVLPAADVIANCDASAIANGCFGDAVRGAVDGTKAADRSLSGLVTMMTAEARGFDLDRHNVFFSVDYEREFREIFRDRRLPSAPSVYVCAQDRPGAATGSERFQLIVNAPATGDGRAPTAGEIEACQTATFAALERCGLQLTPHRTVPVGPATFEALFPSTGGALYGRASHGWRASFRRPGSRSRLAGLWLAGGSAHPGAGVPMAALSGRLASAAILSARASTRLSVPMAIAGGMSTPKATPAAGTASA
ncbi:1-hydroxycarotenoid 3,4-desaturase CrtD [Polymorphobacter fuscus]|uniref:Phytoene desaturase n=1 Tax=Sandarakinorhabdus fusca TaxID=1439888 RepID=A0A7C9GYS5_9SPHN|nr:1-hydroxycarotenoid 3,4-desaturase CrtD [Polymorphobacter fuscus]KAB7644890.1 phytoene desaturase [Polymorphobacter fuscus]MQT18174.1 phytoene desaturase [Polymorphobacter fuscus]NJC09493.1 1-hydroxycarotenoid 3,4-desaturase [Polymorphobacter fuscus]